jgi:drug/metabolite transporter (DMT)-like permease
MIAGSALLTLSDAAVKWLASGYPPGQILFVRGCFLILLIVLVAWRMEGLSSLRIYNVRGQLMRAGTMIFSTFGFVAGLSLLPLADAIALAFAGPLFLTILAVLMLGEKVGWRRWSAVVAGFIGVLIMIRPGAGSFNWAALFPLGASLAGALRDIITRRISATESSLATLHFATLMVMLAGLCTSPFGWQPLPAQDIGVLAIGGLLVGAAHFLLIETFRWAEASLVAPFKYTTLIWGTVFGFIIWGDMPEQEVLSGAAVVIASGLYILRRETTR